MRLSGGNSNTTLNAPRTLTSNPTLTSKKTTLKKTQQSLDSALPNNEKFKTQDISNVKIQSSKDLTIASEIKRMKSWEDHVVAHERMHMLAGGGAVGAPSYVYKMGPDGKMYITGGEVTLYVPKAATLEGSEVALQNLKKAALAPSDPSPKDMAAAAMATAIIDRVRSMIRQKQMKEAYEQSREHELSLKKKNGDHVSALENFKFSKIVAFELMI